LLSAWDYSIHFAAGDEIAVRPDVKPASVAGLLRSSSAAGLTLSSQSVTLLLTSLFQIRATKGRPATALFIQQNHTRCGFSLSFGVFQATTDHDDSTEGFKMIRR